MAVQTTVYNPTVFGVKVGFCVVALLNSFVVIEPLGPIADQLKEYGAAPDVAVADPAAAGALWRPFTAGSSSGRGETLHRRAFPPKDHR